ncbi:MAG TPA: type I-F CRISPR-associated helicase Cas3 [Candidatus Aphodousia faecipullorum]|nr:type I-F CRISPR-associated helicase Cas3 [Candidatus Aphodousia faecipullorum]
MIVILISECEKKAIARTQRVLDAFANRIGERTWRTIITEEGLESLRSQLRRTATKSTAVACHWVRSRKHTELLWIVGNRDKFNEQGYVPVNSTTRSILHSDWENDWRYAPAVKAIVGFSALLHDLGKASESFQTKLKQNQKIGDAYRHEWISVYLFCFWLRQLNLLGEQSSDIGWMQAFKEQQTYDKILKNCRIKDFSVDFSALPPIALLICWLVLGHHRLPDLTETEKLNKFGQINVTDIVDVMSQIKADWGYENPSFLRPSGELIRLSDLRDSASWRRLLKKWADRLFENKELLTAAFQNGSWRLIAEYSRLCLTLGDHSFSSLEKPLIESQCQLFANTDSDSKKLKQRLDDHLVGVCKKALEVAHYLPQFPLKMEYAHDLRVLAKQSPERFRWQDKAVKAIEDFRKNNDQDAPDDAYFVVNMASTGQGKTIANAKMMRALSPDRSELRYTLALGLRTLTLQTGTSYREDIHLQKDDLAIVIGSDTIRRLYEKVQLTQSNTIEQEDSKTLFNINNSVEYTPSVQYDFLDVLFQRNEEKFKAFLYKPVLCCTIDHLMSATEATRGGRFLLPTLRLMTSDLIIDEIDDFGVGDLVAIARLVHLAGMFGRKVMISSATIAPDLALGLFDAYQHGRVLYDQFKGKSGSKIHCLWVDEFKSDLSNVSTGKDCCPEFEALHAKFVQKRCARLQNQITKQLAYLIKIDKKDEQESSQDALCSYFEKIKDSLLLLHDSQSDTDSETGKRVSFGLVRMANVKPCIQFSQFLLSVRHPDYEFKVLTYHSRELLLLRNAKEKYLDTVFRRKKDNSSHTLHNSIVRQHILHTSKKNVVFVVVSTPVEEVGRDHDFDWCVVEPSSMRSIIQLAGRVRRHRPQSTDVVQPNVGILQFNLKAMLGIDPAFSRPGFESEGPHYRLKTKDMQSLLNWDRETMPINAIARIKKPCPLEPTSKLVDLEHKVIQDKLIMTEQRGAAHIHGWLQETWFMTGLPQRFNAFRDKTGEVPIFLCMQEGQFQFCLRDEKNDFLKCEDKFGIEIAQLSDFEKENLWLKINVMQELKNLYLDGWKGCESAEEVLRCSPELGEIRLLPTDPTRYRNVYIESLGLMCGVRKDHDQSN